MLCIACPVAALDSASLLRAKAIALSFSSLLALSSFKCSTRLAVEEAIEGSFSLSPRTNFLLLALKVGLVEASPKSSPLFDEVGVLVVGALGVVVSLSEDSSPSGESSISQSLTPTKYHQ